MKSLTLQFPSFENFAPCGAFFRMSYIPRWSVCNTLQKQSVAEHCYRVACIAGHLAKRVEAIDDKFLVDVYEASLWHDIDEAFTGDVPTPSKKRKPPEELGVTDEVVKGADLIEALLFLKEERTLGNTGLDKIEKQLTEKLHCWQGQWVHTDTLLQVFSEFNKAHEEEVVI